jgi:hypothetical protein
MRKGGRRRNGLRKLIGVKIDEEECLTEEGKTRMITEQEAGLKA